MFKEAQIMLPKVNYGQGMICLCRKESDLAILIMIDNIVITFSIFRIIRLRHFQTLTYGISKVLAYKVHWANASIRQNIICKSLMTIRTFFSYLFEKWLFSLPLSLILQKKCDKIEKATPFSRDTNFHYYKLEFRSLNCSFFIHKVFVGPQKLVTLTCYVFKDKYQMTAFLFVKLIYLPSTHKL